MQRFESVNLRALGESARQRRDRRREEVLSAARDNPLSRQAQLSGLSLWVRARHGARRGISSLTNDGIESGDKVSRFVNGEVDVIGPSCAKNQRIYTSLEDFVTYILE